MALRRKASVGAVLDEGHILMPKETANAFTDGCVVSWDRSAKQLILATSSHDNHSADCLYGVVYGEYAATATECNVVPFANNQMWECDCTNDTASTQIGSRCVLTDQNYLNNSATDDTSGKGIFEITKLVGSASDKKVIVRIVGMSGQVTA